MGSRYSYFKDVQDVITQHMIKGYFDIDLYNSFRFQDDSRYKIPIEHQYRPDLISYKFYRDPKLFWILVYANRFYNSPEDFETDIVIRVPRYERIIDIV
jgi:hypothetical protein